MLSIDYYHALYQAIVYDVYVLLMHYIQVRSRLTVVSHEAKEKVPDM